MSNNEQFSSGEWFEKPVDKMEGLTPYEQSDLLLSKKIEGAHERGLDEVMASARFWLQQATSSDAEVQDKLEEREASIGRIKNIEQVRESRLGRVEKYDPLGELSTEDYQRLLEEEVIDNEYMDRLIQLDLMILEFEGLEHPSPEAFAQLEALHTVRASLHGELAATVEERQEEIDTKRQETYDHVLEVYENRIEQLEDTITRIESDPRVLEALRESAEKEMDEVLAQRQAEKEAHEEALRNERSALTRETMRTLQSLQARQANAFRRVAELLSDEGVPDRLRGALDSNDENVFEQVRMGLIRAIVDGEGEGQLRDPKEVVPWEVRTSSIDYSKALHSLRSGRTEKSLRKAVADGDERAQHLLDTRGVVLKDHGVLRKLFGTESSSSDKDSKKGEGTTEDNRFYRAFTTRQFNDAYMVEGGSNVTQLRKEQREEAERNRIKKEREDLERLRQWALKGGRSR